MHELHAIARILDRPLAKLQPVVLENIIRFVLYASHLRDDIILTQPALIYTPESTSLPILPPSIKGFLSDAASIPLGLVDDIWHACGRLALTASSLKLSESVEPSAYKTFGHQRGITHRILYPPSQSCMDTTCERSKRMMLKKSESRQCVLFTMSGAVPVWSVHLYCELCRVNYHHNFYVRNNSRIYYDGIPEILQIGEHQFAEVKLINVWISMMQLSWTSATNCARIYNTAFSTVEPLAWQFSLSVTAAEVYDAFTLLSLLEDCQIRQDSLIVPHDGVLEKRFQAVVRARNERFRLHSQPDLFHYCDKCTRFFGPERRRLERKVSVVVIDGVTVGHPCCGVANCKIPLDNNQARFCPSHEGMKDICAVVGCNDAVSGPGRKTCALPPHSAVEDFHNHRGEARFQLKSRLEHARVAHPNDSIAHDVSSSTEILDGNKEEESFEVTSDGNVLAVPVNDTKPKVKAKFGRTRTHNEQLFVMPCGIIVARETFYHAEAIYSVVEMIKRTYRIPGTMPNHIFFDNNCQVARIVKDDPAFNDVGLTVDVFHFNCKHSKTDEFCKKHCDPSAYPELLGEGKKRWYFNSSIAKQTNAWFGGYHAICREMRVDRYNFFLDEMVRRRNMMTLKKLKDEGCHPSRWPYPTPH